jgi:hypothetical protein
MYAVVMFRYVNCLKACSNLCTHSISFNAIAAAINSASAVDCATIVCSLDSQIIGDLFAFTTKPDVLFRIIGSPAKVASVYASLKRFR